MMDLIEREKALLDYVADYIYEQESRLEIKYWKLGVFGKSTRPAKPPRREYKTFKELIDFIDFINNHVQGSLKIPEYRRFDYKFLEHIETLVENFKQERKNAILHPKLEHAETEATAGVDMQAEEARTIDYLKGWITRYDTGTCLLKKTVKKIPDFIRFIEEGISSKKIVYPYNKETIKDFISRRVKTHEGESLSKAVYNYFSRKKPHEE
jgi:hypothetical protein